MRIALKVDVDTLKGTFEGVPALLRLFEKHDLHATFLFSLGPDHTGRAIRRVFRPGFVTKVRRTAVASHYGWKTLLYGTLLPGPHIGRRAGHVMRTAADAGHEVGIHCYDHVRWQDYVAKKDAGWTRREMEKAASAFHQVFGRPAAVVGAAGWQINRHALALEERMGFRYASDVRGESPFYPIMDDLHFSCMQLPTTLPTLDELLGVEGIGRDELPGQIFMASRRARAHGHVYTLHAELEGMALLDVMDRLLTMWLAAGDEVGTLEDNYRTLESNDLESCPIMWEAVPGRSGLLAVQGGISTKDAVA